MREAGGGVEGEANQHSYFAKVCRQKTKIFKSLVIPRKNKNDVSLKVDSHDPFLNPISFLGLFQLIEMLIHVVSLYEFE